MNHKPFLVAIAGSLLLAGTGAFAAQGKAGPYKWVDKNGVTHYGDTIPPEYASQGHEQLNSQGVPVRETERQLSPGEAAEAQKHAAEEARRRQHDSFLLSTYTQLSEIEQLRDERVGLLDAQIDLARGSLSSTDQRITALQKRLAGFKPYSDSPTARRVPDQLAEEVVRALSERRSMLTTVERREKEKADLLAGFAADIERFKELKSRPSYR